MDPTSLESNLSHLLKKRAEKMRAVRTFFETRGVTEVDTACHLSKPNLAVHIDPLATEKGFLRTSPEYAMKRLLALGSGDIFEMSHVFRKEEKGPNHSEEFMMIEWYRLGFELEELIAETIDLVSLFCPDLPVQRWTYASLFEHFLKINPHTCTKQELIDLMPKSYPIDGSEDRDYFLFALLGEKIEPHLKDGIHVIAFFPESQSALARLVEDQGIKVAARFEIYVQGKEIANGYDELINSKEQRQRFVERNIQRAALNKPTLELDEAFIESLDQVPSCCGVAVGFDRLLMLSERASHLQDVIPIWDA